MHKSIFITLSEYKTNPILEFYKIEKILYKKCDFDRRLIDILDTCFMMSDFLRFKFVCINDALESFRKVFRKFQNCIYDVLEQEDKYILEDAYLNYCEILYHLFSFLTEDFILRFDFYDNRALEQAKGMICSGLKAMNFKIVCIDEKQKLFEVIKINQGAEVVAALSPTNIKEAIIGYLGARDSDIAEKETRLLTLINLLTPNIKKYRNEKTISKVSEFVQLIRHSEEKKEEPAYKWFYENKSKYLDDIFSLCLFAQHYFLAKETISMFDHLKENNIAK